MEQLMETCCDNRMRVFSLLSVLFGVSSICLLYFTWSALLFAAWAIFFACFGWKRETKRWIRCVGFVCGALTWLLTIAVVAYAAITLHNAYSDYSVLLKEHESLVQELEELYQAEASETIDVVGGDWSVEEYEKMRVKWLGE